MREWRYYSPGGLQWKLSKGSPATPAPTGKEADLGLHWLLLGGGLPHGNIKWDFWDKAMALSDYTVPAPGSNDWMHVW
jgi:hypothetical protein